MTRKILLKLSFLFIITISLSCSKNEDLKKLSSAEITNYLLVNEQLPVKILSNALEVPENVIIGINLGLIKLNENGEEKLDDILEGYLEDGKVDFIGDNVEKKWSNFSKSDWIERETTKISMIKLNEIKENEFKNNKIIQNKLNLFIPYYIEKQTDELSSNQFSFFSRGFWKNMGQIAWMHVKSISEKISRRDLNYLKPDFKDELQLKWQTNFNLYFSPKKAKLEMDKILSNYQNLINIKYKYFSTLTKKEFNQNPGISLNFKKLNKSVVIDVKPIIAQFNLIMLDNFGQLFIELLTGLLIATILNFFLRRITKDEDEKRSHIISTFFKTGLSPFHFLISSTAFLGNIVTSNQAREKYKSASSIINKIIGFLLIVFSFWYISRKQNKIETEINGDFKTNFSSHFDKTSFQVLENLNLNTELLFI